jgi:hypothetical protein
LNEFP